MNDIKNIIQQLEQQREAIDRALSALRAIGGVAATKTVAKAPAKKKRHLSPEGRARIAEATRRRWAAKRAAEAKKGKKTAAKA